MRKITWCAVARAPYLDFLLSEVNKSFELNVFYKIEERTHPWTLGTVNYKNQNIRGNLLNAMYSVKGSDILVMSGWSFWQHLIIMILPFRSVKKVYFCDTIDLDNSKWSGMKGLIRKLIVKIVFKVFDQVWSTGIPGCEALEKLGCKKSKIGSFGFSPDIKKYDSLDQKMAQDAKLFRQKNINQDTNKVFLCSGRLIESKRFDNIIKAIAKIQNKDAILWITGTGPMEDQLRKLAIDLEVSEQIKFLGWLNQREVDLSNIAADIYVHPASFDPFPNVVLDAMSWAKPIIGSYESGSVRDRVVHGVSGYVYPSDNFDELVKYIRTFINLNFQDINEFGLKSRKTACENSIENSVERLEKVLS